MTIDVNKEKLIKVLNDTIKSDESEIRMYFYTSDNKIYQPKLDRETYKTLKISFLEPLIKTLKKLGEIQPFDLDGNLDSELAYLDPKKGDIKPYLDLSKLLKFDKHEVLEKKDIKKFYEHIKASIFIINNKITLMKKFSYPKKLLSNSILNIKKYPLEQVKEDIFSIDSRVDFFEIDGNVYILNNNSFEVIFSLESQYKEQINNTINILEDADILENLEEFKEDCLKTKPKTKKLLKLLNNNNFNAFKNRRNLVEEVIKTHDLDVELSPEGKIVYSKKETVNEILNLLGDNYYVSSILEEKRLAKANKKI